MLYHFGRREFLEYRKLSAKQPSESRYLARINHCENKNLVNFDGTVDIHDFGDRDII